MRLLSVLLDTSKKYLRPYWQAYSQFITWLSPQPRIVYLKFFRIFIAAPTPKQADGKLYLHLGCGTVDHEKFINIDGYPFPHVHYVQSIDKLPQFETECVDLIYACHCLEHFSCSQTESVLREWFRVLKKGGILRLSVPDFDKLVNIYQIHNNDPDIILPQLMGGQENKYNYHLTSLNLVNLTRYLERVGFSRIQKWHPGRDELTTFDDFSTYRKEVEGKFYEISLNLEAIK